jgi:hypothetical protein
MLTCTIPQFSDIHLALDVFISITLCLLNFQTQYKPVDHIFGTSVFLIMYVLRDHQIVECKTKHIQMDIKSKYWILLKEPLHSSAFLVSSYNVLH